MFIYKDAGLLSVGSSEDLVLSDNTLCFCRRHPRLVITEACLRLRWCVRRRGSLMRYPGNCNFAAGPAPGFIVLLWIRGNRK